MDNPSLTPNSLACNDFIDRMKALFADGHTLSKALSLSGHNVSKAHFLKFLQSHPQIQSEIDESRADAVYVLEQDLSEIQTRLSTESIDPSAARAAAAIIQWRLERLDKKRFGDVNKPPVVVNQTTIEQAVISIGDTTIPIARLRANQPETIDQPTETVQ